MNFPDTPEMLIAQARALIDEVQSELTACEDLLRTHGIDPEKLRGTMENHLSVHGREQAWQAFQADMQAVEQEVHEEVIRQSFASSMARGSGVRQRHAMV